MLVEWECVCVLFFAGSTAAQGRIVTRGAIHMVCQANTYPGEPRSCCEVPFAPASHCRGWMWNSAATNSGAVSSKERTQREFRTPCSPVCVALREGHEEGVEAHCASLAITLPANAGTNMLLRLSGRIFPCL